MGVHETVGPPDKEVAHPENIDKAQNLSREIEIG